MVQTIYDLRRPSSFRQIVDRTSRRRHVAQTCNNVTSQHSGATLRSVPKQHLMDVNNPPAVNSCIQSVRTESRGDAALLRSVLEQHLTDINKPIAFNSCTDSDSLLGQIYKALDEEIFFSRGAFLIPGREKSQIDATGGSASYGEVQASGISQLIRFLALDSSSVFVDLGSGRGRAVLQVAMHSPVSKTIGLELSDSRLEQAEMALAILRQQGHSLRPVEFRHADLSSCSLNEGTHFYFCSTAFGAGICRSIAERLCNSPNFQVLVTSRQLPTQPYLYKLAEVPCEFSYNADGRGYLYVKSPAAAPPSVLSKVWCKDGLCWLPSTNHLQLGLSVDEPLVAVARDFVILSAAGL